MTDKTDGEQKKERPAHLFKKGKSGNPAGRPKGTKNSTFSATAQELLSAENIEVTWSIRQKNGSMKDKHLKLESTKNMHYGIVASLIMEALKGNVRAVKELIDRSEGKAKEFVEHAGSIDIRFDREDKDL